MAFSVGSQITEELLESNLSNVSLPSKTVVVEVQNCNDQLQWSIFSCFRAKMSENPWLVENLLPFLFLNCPECDFKSKTKTIFQNHAQQNHSSSYVFFEKLIEDDQIHTDMTEENEVLKKVVHDSNSLNAQFQNSEKILEEIMFSESMKNDDYKQKLESDNIIYEKAGRN